MLRRYASVEGSASMRLGDFVASIASAVIGAVLGSILTVTYQRFITKRDVAEDHKREVRRSVRLSVNSRFDPGGVPNTVPRWRKAALGGSYGGVLTDVTFFFRVGDLVLMLPHPLATVLLDSDSGELGVALDWSVKAYLEASQFVEATGGVAPPDQAAQEHHGESEWAVRFTDDWGISWGAAAPGHVEQRSASWQPFPERRVHTIEDLAVVDRQWLGRVVFLPSEPKS